MAAVLQEQAGPQSELRTKHGNGYGAYSAKVRYVGKGTLTSWKAIAEYIGVCESTAQKWEKRLQLPVCRLPDGRVMTTLSLIDQWVMARIEVQRAERNAR